MIKRVFDFVASLVGLFLLSPLLAVITLLIKVTSPGPVLYRGERSGRYGKAFRIYKFRTMVVNADKIGGPSTSDRDPRITPVGQFMRKLKLDELPQLFNVLRGEMSLVGPRPQVLDYVARFTPGERAILTVRPGITDWASIWNSDEGSVLARHPDPDCAYDEWIHPTKTKLQLLYVQRQNLWIDFKIIAYTLLRIVRRDWTPKELQPFPPPGAATPIATAAHYETVTEMPGMGATREQIAMLHTRYRLAGDLAAGKDVLEVACGPGIGLGHLAARAKRVVGGDFDPQLVQAAQQRHEGRIEVKQFSAERMLFADASFDVVLLLEAVYYLPRPEAFLQEARRVLRPDGTLLINSANCERPDFNPSPFSTRYFSAGELKSLMEDYGFDVEVLAGFPLAQQGLANHVRQCFRNVAVKLRLIPKTMRWKALFKRLFFGKLLPLPAVIGRDLPVTDPLVPVDGSRKIAHYKVLYLVGRRRAQHQRQAA